MKSNTEKQFDCFTKKYKIKNLAIVYKYFGSGKFKVTVSFMRKNDRKKEVLQGVFFTQEVQKLNLIDTNPENAILLYYQLFRLEIEKVVTTKLLTI